VLHLEDRIIAMEGFGIDKKKDVEMICTASG
jgi:hypothetical protein